MVPVLRVLVYYPVRETRMAKAVSSGETSVSRQKRYVGTIGISARTCSALHRAGARYEHSFAARCVHEEAECRACSEW